MRHRIPDEDASLDLTPMIDVTFLLLIFFLCTLQFRTLEGKIESYLPRDSGSGSAEDFLCKVDLTLHVDDPGRRVYGDGSPERFRFEGREVSFRLGPRSTQDPRQLTRWVREMNPTDETRLVLVATEGVVYDDVIRALDALAAGGVVHIEFAGL